MYDRLKRSEKLHRETLFTNRLADLNDFANIAREK